MILFFSSCTSTNNNSSYDDQLSAKEAEFSKFVAENTASIRTMHREKFDMECLLVDNRQQQKGKVSG